jgi:N-acetylmuramoyl-L-alanine amidase
MISGAARIRPGWALGVLSLVASCASAATLQRAELQHAGAVTTLSLQFDSKPQARIFTLAEPQRAVVDLKGFRGGSGLRLPEAAGVVSAMRSGPLAGRQGLRLVLELDGKVQAPRQRYLPPSAGQGHRLLIELTATGAVAARAPALAPAPSPNNARNSQPVRAEHAPAETGRDIIVAVDAGHGGQDPGALGRAGTYEKHVVLAIARLLVTRLNEQPGMRAVLTRDGDYFLALRERIARARRAKADLFVSVHADAVRDRDVSGASVYVLSEKGATDEQARWLAETENAADLKGGVSLDDKGDTLASVLLDLSQSASIAESMRAAERVLMTLGGVSDVRKKQVQQAGFVVLKSPDIPSMLVETAYISNPADEADLRSDAHRERIAAAIANGVREYFVDHPPDGTRFALDRRHGAAATIAAR